MRRVVSKELFGGILRMNLNFNLNLKLSLKLRLNRRMPPKCSLLTTLRRQSWDNCSLETAQSLRKRLNERLSFLAKATRTGDHKPEIAELLLFRPDIRNRIVVASSRASHRLTDAMADTVDQIQRNLALGCVKIMQLAEEKDKSLDDVAKAYNEV